MSPPPNELYTAFSFIGFVLCAIPFYWHLQGTWNSSRDSSIILRMHGPAWNTGTCLYMIWAGLGCLVQCINSIVWNKNMVNRAPIYCDIGESVDLSSLERSLTLRHHTVARLQVAQNVAIPACSLCINRRLYKIATAKVAMTTSAERRRAVIQDLLIGLGIPILQMIVRECIPLFMVSELFTRMQPRIRCMLGSLRHY
jgi:pheromone a factor receptor